MATSTDSPSQQQPPPAADTSPTSDEKTFYTWSNFFALLTSTASPTTRAAYFTERDKLHEKTDIERCNREIKHLFRTSPIITFLKHNIDLLGPADGAASIGPHNVHCRRCDANHQKGGFDWQYGIMLCANQMATRGVVEDTLAHEMMHAYDYLRFQLDPLDLRHAACMEIRASTLSGECGIKREMWTRGQWKLTAQLQECVRRRATLSVNSRPACKDMAMAERVVNEVWGSCFNDTRPFDEIYK